VERIVVPEFACQGLECVRVLHEQVSWLAAVSAGQAHIGQGATFTIVLPRRRQRTLKVEESLMQKITAHAENGG